ncbi:unnamed protein product [Ectocarpus sp. CCAP 1310/34]|nr:unnamed protein product [Ectocarpus sp. CCAP 1310/34]
MIHSYHPSHRVALPDLYMRKYALQRGIAGLLEGVLYISASLHRCPRPAKMGKGLR